MYSPEWIQQVDYRLSGMMNRYGCFARAIANGAEAFFDEALSIRQIREIGQRARKEGAINDKFFLQNSDSHQHVLNITLDVMGKYAEGWRGEYLGSKEPAHINDAEGVFYIDEYDVTNAASHFLRADADGTVLFNPMPDLKLGDVKSRRVFVISKE